MLDGAPWLPYNIARATVNGVRFLRVKREERAKLPGFVKSFAHCEPHEKC